MRALWDEDGDHEISYQVGEEDPSSDCYKECIIRGEFSEPTLEEDIFLKSFNFLSGGSEQEFSKQVFDDANSLFECSLHYMEKGAKQEFPQHDRQEASSWRNTQH